ncbi:hypothetical protein ACKI2N_025150 [Cupriavidus sp. 30B13]|uniref:hypothetical protein n=1 Tax=Cupriavidus sp. 30B13 TaxID=3384241 RepID=UPI003B8F6259
MARRATPRLAGLLPLLAAGALCGAPALAPDAAAAAGIDRRAYMHGIGAAAGPAGQTYVFFSSSGLPPRGPGRDRNWTHDIYVAAWAPGQRALGEPRVLFARKEAQEPVSVAQAADGRIMLTFEDGWNTARSVSQRYLVYGADLQPRRAGVRDVRSGGHSGHVAAVGNRFVVFYSDDWVDGGGVDDLGTGNGVYLKTYDSAGKLLRSADVARDARQWWPLLAASDNEVLLAWQEYVPDRTYARLKTAVYRPGDAAPRAVQVLDERLAYYTYGVAYVPALGRFLVVGTGDDGKGFAHLLDTAGRVAASLPCMPASVREAGIAVIGDKAFTPARDGRLLHLALSADAVRLAGSQPSPIPWTIQGSLGLAHSAASLHWISLTPAGLREADFDLAAATPPSPADLCR